MYYEYQIGNKVIYGWKGWGCGPFVREVTHETL